MGDGLSFIDVLVKNGARDTSTVIKSLNIWGWLLALRCYL
jgi:hypothetical protein